MCYDVERDIVIAFLLVCRLWNVVLFGNACTRRETFPLSCMAHPSFPTLHIVTKGKGVCNTGGLRKIRNFR